MAAATKAVAFLLLIILAVASARDLGQYSHSKKNFNEKPAVLVLEGDSLLKDFKHNHHYFTSSSEENDRPSPHAHLHNLHQSHNNGPLTQYQGYNRHDHYNHRQKYHNHKSNQYGLQDRQRYHDQHKDRQKYYDLYRDEVRQHHTEDRQQDREHRHRGHERDTRQHRQQIQRYHELDRNDDRQQRYYVPERHEQHRQQDMKKQHAHRYDRVRQQDREERQRYRGDREDRQKNRYRDRYDKPDDEQDSEYKHKKHEMFQVRSPIVKSLLRISNDLQCGLRSECQDECNEKFDETNKVFNCQDKCEEKFDCNDEKGDKKVAIQDDRQNEANCEGDDDECAATAEDNCNQENGNISTKGELYEPEKGHECKRCKK